MNRLIFIFFIFSLLFHSLFTQSEANQTYAQSGVYYTHSGMQVPELSAVDIQVQKFMRKWDLPGASVALVKDGRLVYARGFGKADEDTPVTPEHLFRIASLSKSITATAVMKLIQDGLLEVDALVFGEKGLLNSPMYQNIQDERIQSITLRQLLTHTAGWNRKVSPIGDPMLNTSKIARAMGARAPANQQIIIQYMLLQPLDFDPGSRFAYSNFGYCVIGRIIEKVTGMSYEAYVQEYILRPLGITDMQLAKNYYETKHAKEVRYYDIRGRGVVPSDCEPSRKVSFPYGGYNVEVMDALGGWVASATSLAKLLLALDPLNPRPDYLPASLINQMTTPCQQYKGYGLGWFVTPPGSFWNTGSLPGSSSIMSRTHDGMVWVALYNGNPQTKAYFSALEKLMGKALGNVQQWPEHDLLLPTVIVQSDQIKQ